MSAQRMEQHIHGLEDIRDVILNGDIILRDATRSRVQLCLLYTALKGLLTQVSSLTELVCQRL